MNNFLEDPLIQRIQSIGNTGDIIIQNLTKNTHGFDTFVELLNMTTWQSSRELSDILIRKFAGQEYAQLFPEGENTETDEVKECTKDLISEHALDLLHECTQNLSRWQQLKSKFIVTYMLARELPIPDQDRILAREMGVSYEVWQQMLGFFSHNMDFTDILKSEESSLEQALMTGEKGFILSTGEGNTEKIIPLGDLPGTGLVYQSEEDTNPLLFISEQVFKRYDKIIHMKEKESLVRDVVRERFGDICVYKRF